MNDSKNNSLKKMAVWKFSSCDGCQLSLLHCEDELLKIADRLEIAYFMEASSQCLSPPYDLSLIEGSISTPHEEDLVRQIRKVSRYVVTIGACATSGGIQALRNFSPFNLVASTVYPHPEWIKALAHTQAISKFIPVDFELSGCPVAKDQLIEVILAYLDQRTPQIPRESVCAECKRHEIPCIVVSRGVPCLGPMTQAGCQAICPTHGRGCYGCFGIKENANVEALARSWEEMGQTNKNIVDALRFLHAWADPLREVSGTYES